MKKIVSILLIFCLLFSFSFSYTEDEAANILVTMKLMSGYPDGTLGLERDITRAEFCTLIAKMLSIDNEESFAVEDFSDLPNNHWAYKNVMALATRGIISGYGDTTFRPSNNVTYAECSAILVGVLGYKEDMEGVWPTNVTSMAEKLKLDKGFSVEASEKMTRGNVSIMLVNSMDVEMKGN